MCETACFSTALPSEFIVKRLIFSNLMDEYLTGLLVCSFVIMNEELAKTCLRAIFVSIFGELPVHVFCPFF